MLIMAAISYLLNSTSANFIKPIIPIRNPDIRLPKCPKKSTPGNTDITSKLMIMLRNCFLLYYTLIFFFELM